MISPLDGTNTSNSPTHFSHSMNDIHTLLHTILHTLIFTILHTLLYTLIHTILHTLIYKILHTLP